MTRLKSGFFMGIQFWKSKISIWKLRKAIKTVNQHFAKLKLKQHPNKTIIGRIKAGSDFLGYQFGEEKITVSKRRLENHIRRLTQPLFV